MTDFLKVKNRAVTSLAKELLIGDTIMEVVDTSAIPSEGRFRLTVEDEIVEVTDVDGGSLTIIRGVEGTTPIYHANGRTVSLNITAGIIEELQGAVSGMITLGANITPVGAHLAHANEAVRTVTGVSDYVKLKETMIGIDVKKTMVGLAAKVGQAGQTASVKVGINGTNLTELSTVNSVEWQFLSIPDYTDLKAGDLFQVYVKPASPSYSCSVSQLYFSCNQTIDKIAGLELEEPIYTDVGADLKAVDQDP